MILFGVETYDPQSPDDGPSESSGSQYLTKKDFKYIVIILCVLAVLMYPVYKVMLEQKNQSVCKQNMHQIFIAMTTYAEMNEQRFPPTYVVDEGAPYIDAKGRAITWVSLLQEGMNKRQSFVCPSADDDEKSVSQHPESFAKSIESTYGMYFPYGHYPMADLSNPDRVSLLAETSNYGSGESYNPTPFTRGGAPVKQDGFVVGYSDSNSKYSASSKLVTRLAFRGTKDGEFKDPGQGRHNKGILIMSASGSIAMYPPSVAAVKFQASGIPVDKWAVPAGWTPD